MLHLPPPLRSRILLPVLVLGCSVFTVRARGDALVVTKAMQATTVAEFYVGESSVRVELEIGVADLAAFANLLPDEICWRRSRPRRKESARSSRCGYSSNS